MVFSNGKIKEEQFFYINVSFYLLLKNLYSSCVLSACVAGYFCKKGHINHIKIFIHLTKVRLLNTHKSWDTA